MKYYLDYAKKLLFIIDKRIYQLLPLIFLFLFVSLIEILGIGMIIPFMNLVINPERFREINLLGISNFNDLLIFFSSALVVIFIIKTIFSIYIRWAISKFAFKQYSYLQTNMLNAYQRMNYLDFSKRNISEYTRNIKEMTSTVISGVEVYLRLISEIIIFSIIIFYLCFINFKVILTLFIIVGLITFFFEFFFKSLAIKFGDAKTEASGLIYKGIESAVNGIKEIKILQRENFFINIIKKGAEKVYKNETKHSLIAHSPRYIFELALVVFLLSFLTISILVNNNINTILPIISVFAIAGVRLLPSASIILHSFNALNFYYKPVTIIFKDLKKFKKEVNPVESKKILLKKNKAIFQDLKLKNIYFKYPKSKKNIISNISFNLKARECIGIVGKSGSGKTTLMDLILGLIEPNKGRIFLNGKEITNNSKQWLDQVSYLPQEPLIMEDTLRANICFDDMSKAKTENNEKIKRAIKKANIEQFIKKLPNGLNTRIGQNGIRLSGGQKKRIAIARTFFHDRQVIIMDEATSALDAQTENLILEQLKILKKKKTIILITHNPNTLKYCDKVYKIVNGKIK
jgi:ATP-binding cassette, subfamily B, bacterial PglK